MEVAIRRRNGSRVDVPPNARALIGETTGLVRGIRHYLPDRADPQVFYSSATVPDVAFLADIGTDLDVEAGGTGLDLADSVMSAVGEMVERYSLCFPRVDNLVEASYDEMVDRGRHVPEFDYLDVYSTVGDAEVGIEPFAPDVAVQWYEGTDLLTGDGVYVPAQLLWFGVPDRFDSLRYFLASSNGAAAGGSPKRALLGSLYEVIERDAVMTTWFRRASTKAVDLAAWPEVEDVRTDRIDTAFRRADLVEFESPTGVPVVGCAITDRRDRPPKFVLSGSCSLERRSAYLDAMVEAAQSLAFVKDRMAADDSDVGGIDPGRIYDLEDNLLWYAQPDQFEDVRFLLDGEGGVVDDDERRSFDSVDEELVECLDRLGDTGATPIAVDLTTDEIRDLGFYVTRVVVPELVDLALPSLPPDTHPRLSDTELTEKPHPYP